MSNNQYPEQLIRAGCSRREVVGLTGLSEWKVRKLMHGWLSRGEHKAIRCFGFTDIHYSDRDQRALDVARKAQSVFKPDITVIGGDLMNCTAFSRHPKRKIEDATYDYIEDELTPCVSLLDDMQANTRDKTIFLEGNHDEWLERWIRNTEGGAAFSSVLPSVGLRKTAAGKERKNFEYVSFSPGTQSRTCNYELCENLIVTHGWCAPKYAAQHHLDKARNVSVIFHHTHRFDHRAGTLYDGAVIEAMSAGCLCNRVPLYAHNGSPTDWVLGFWVAFIGSRSFTVYPIKIGKDYQAVLPDGTEVWA